MKTILVACLIIAAATGLKLMATPPVAVPASKFEFLVHKVAAPTTPGSGAVEFLPIGNPVVGSINKKGKLVATIIGSVTLVLRSDGLVGWKLSEEAEEQFRKEADKGIKMPPTPYDSGKR